MRSILLALLAVVVASPFAQAKPARGHHRGGLAAKVLTQDERAALKTAIQEARKDASVAPLIEAAHKARAALHEAREEKKPEAEVRQLRKALHQDRKAVRKAVHAILAKNPAVAGLIEKLKAARQARHEKHEKRESAGK